MICSGQIFSFRALKDNLLHRGHIERCLYQPSFTILSPLPRRSSIGDAFSNKKCHTLHHISPRFFSSRTLLQNTSLFCKNLFKSLPAPNKSFGVLLQDKNAEKTSSQSSRRSPFVSRFPQRRNRVHVPRTTSLSSFWYFLGIVVLLLSYQNLCFDYYGPQSIVPYLVLVPLFKEIIEVDIAQISKWWLIVALYPPGFLSVGLARVGIIWPQLYAVELVVKKLFEIYRDYHILKNLGYFSPIALAVMTIPTMRPLAILQISICNQVHPQAKNSTTTNLQKTYSQLCSETGSVMNSWNALIAPNTPVDQVKHLPVLAPLTRQDVDSNNNLLETSKIKFQPRFFSNLVSQAYSSSQPMWSIVYRNFFDLELFLNCIFKVDTPEMHLHHLSALK